jgi:hypothetical protein
MKLEQSGEMAYLLGKQMECEITTRLFREAEELAL